VIRYDLPVGGQVKLSVYDLKGRRVATLVNAKLPPGSQQVTWNGRDDRGGEVAAGVYLYRLVVDGATAGQRKMVLVK
jgi:flagellar hook assembly protein FlgD